MKLNKLENILKSYKRITVALSGGVDSAFLLAFASKVLGTENVRAITACGPHLAEDEVEYAKTLCASLGIDQIIVRMDHIMSLLEPNSSERCYHCKKAMFSALKEVTAKASAGDHVLADGTNIDDMDDYRPGHKALAELNIVSPLKNAGLTKNEIREALEKMAGSSHASAFTLADGTPIWEKPAFACLASRIPYGEIITKDKLDAIYRAETFLRYLGLRQVRVRHHGDIARIEVPAENRCVFFDEGFMDKVNEAIKECGFKFAVLDLGGYKMGGGFHNGQNVE